ncbi:MAG: SDR family oxidoreductase [Aggregatilineales bacterium]
MSDLQGKVAVVTGAAQGLGYAVAKAYIENGMRVAIMDVKEDELVAVAKEFGKNALAIAADLSNAESTLDAIHQVLTRLGTPRILVHNAAILINRPLLELTLESWHREINVGIQAAFLMTQAVWQAMTEAGGGSIVYVSSRSGIQGFMDESPYCTAKHGLEGFMKCMAMEGEMRNIAVNTVTPGMYMHTPMSERNYSDELKQKWVDPYMLTPAFVKLASQDASGISGQRLNAWELSGHTGTPD